MMSLEQIHAESRRAAACASRVHKVPFILEREDLDALLGGNLSTFRSFPFLGTFCPKGWRRVSLITWFPDEFSRSSARVHFGDNAGAGAFFVDSSGFGAVGEPALRAQDLPKFLRPGFGYAIVEAGQFQVKIGVFEKRAAR